MATPYIGELKIVSFNFAPKGWALCNGQTLSINQNSALFALLGTTYGGNGTTTFALPDLRSRVPISFGQGPGLSAYSLGQKGGEENHTLTVGEMPQHLHTSNCSSAGGTSQAPLNHYWALDGKGAVQVYATSADSVMGPAAVSSVGGSQAHPNLMPYLVLTVIIALVGVFPSRN